MADEAHTRLTTELYVIVRLGEEWFGIPARLVDEAVALPRLLPGEAMRQGMIGFLDLRGRLVPVLDVAARFGFPNVPRRLEEVIVVVNVDTAADSGVVGLLFHGAVDMRPLLPVPTEFSRRPGPIVGEYRADGRVVAVLDLERLLADEGTPGGRPVVEYAGDASAQALFDRRAERLRLPGEGGDWELLEGLHAVVEVGAELLAIHLAQVREFAPLESVTPIPCVPPHVRGFVNLRGELITVLDVGPILGIESASAEHRQLLVSGATQAIGLPLRQVREVMVIDPEQVLPLPAGLDADTTDALTGAVRLGDRSVAILDLERLLLREALQVDETV